MAAVLACGPGAALGHLSAAASRGVIVADGASVDVVTGRGRKGQPGIRVHRPLVAPAVTEYGGIPATTIAQTLLDLAAGFTVPALARAFGEAELLPDYNEAELERLVQSSPGHRGVRKLRAVMSVDDGPGVPRNILERRFRTAVRRAGLPQPLVNEPLLGYEIDFLWPGLVAVETDGRSVHARRAAFARDRERDRALQLAGLVALRFTYAEVTRRPAMVAETCRQALDRASRQRGPH